MILRLLCSIAGVYEWSRLLNGGKVNELRGRVFVLRRLTDPLGLHGHKGIHFVDARFQEHGQDAGGVLVNVLLDLNFDEVENDLRRHDMHVGGQERVVQVLNKDGEDASEVRSSELSPQVVQEVPDGSKERDANILRKYFVQYLQYSERTATSLGLPPSCRAVHVRQAACQCGAIMRVDETSLPGVSSV